jgi:hypothetical protein
MARDGASQGSRENAMRKHMVVSDGHSPFYLSLCLSVLFAPLGCAHTLPPPPLSDATQAQLGTIGVVAARFPPGVDYRTPARGGASGAAIGTAKGLGIGTLGAAGCFITSFIPMGQSKEVKEACFFAVATPLLAAKLAVDHATQGFSAEEVAASEAAIRTALADRPIQEALREQVLRVAATQTAQSFVSLQDQGPSRPTEINKYQHLTGQGIETILELAVQQIALRPCDSACRWSPQRPGPSESHKGVLLSAEYLNPGLAVVATTRTRVIKVQDGKELYSYTMERSGKAATFTEWGANDAQLLRESIDQLTQEIAEVIVSQVFWVSVPTVLEPADASNPGQDTEPEPQRSFSRDFPWIE